MTARTHDLGRFNLGIFPRDIRENPRSMYARVRVQAMVQFVLKIEKMSHMHGVNPNSRNGARLRSPSLIMAPAEK